MPPDRSLSERTSVRERRPHLENLEKEKKILDQTIIIERLKANICADDAGSQNLSGFEEWIRPAHVAAPKLMAAPSVRPPGISSVGNAGNFSPAGSAIWHDLSTPPNPRTVLELSLIHI